MRSADGPTQYPNFPIGIANKPFPRAVHLGQPVGGVRPLHRDVPVQFPPIPSFSPERSALARGGIEQFEQEGAVQVLRSDKRGEQAPLFATVGPTQFEVATHRMATELSAPISQESLPYQVARISFPEDADFVSRQVPAEVPTRIVGSGKRGCDHRSPRTIPSPHTTAIRVRWRRAVLTRVRRCLTRDLNACTDHAFCDYHPLDIACLPARHREQTCRAGTVPYATERSK